MFDGTTQPPFVGFYDTGAQPVLKYVYTGIPDTQSSGMTIDGVSSYDLDDGAGAQQTPFTLDLYEYQDADYMLDTMWFKGLDDEIMNSGSEVPVNIFEDNTITLSHDNQEVAVEQRPITTSFHWMPSASVVESFFEFAYIEEYRIGSQSDIHVITEPYSGDISDLYLEIVELDLGTLIDGEPAQNKLERYEATYVESITEDQSGKDKSRITFERVDADYMGLDLAMNTYDLRANLVFDNTALTSLGAIETLLDGTLEADFNPPEPYNFDFEGVVDGVYYFIIGLNDEVDVTQLSANKDLFLDLFNKTADMSGVNIVSVEGYQDPMDTMQTTDGTYKMIRLGVDTLLPPRTELVFKGTVENNGSADLNIEFDSATDELLITGEYAGDGELVFHVVDSGGADPFDFHVNSRTGGFNLYLPDGDYAIEEFNFNEMWVELDTPIGLNIPSTSSPYYIDLNDYYNAVIRVLDESGQVLEGYRVEVENEFSWMYQNAVTNAAGDAFFNFEVPDDGSNAMVRVVGYEYKDKWYDLYDQNLMLNVNKTHGGTNKAVLSITVQKPNFTGEVYYSYPDKKITNGHLDIRWKSDSGTMMDEWYNVWIDESGSFTFVLPKVGTYVIESAGANYGDMETSWFEINKSVEVIDDGTGKLLVVEPGTTTPVTMPMTITKAQPNFTGHLYKTGTTPYLATVDPLEYYVAMVVQQTGVDPILLEYEPWNYEYRIDVKQGDDIYDPGYFEANLDPSNSYQVVGVETSRGWFEFSTPVPIVLSSDSSSTITAPTPNVNGVIAEFDGTPITGINYGHVEFEKADGSQWMGADIDETGNFGIALESGADYVIREYWYDTETTPGVFTNHYVRLDRKITVGTNSDQMTLGPNFMINLSASADLLGVPTTGTQEYNDFLMYDNYFNANVRPVLTSADFDTDAKYQDYLSNPWNYGLWLEGKYKESTGKIEFYTYLDAGTYELMDVNGMYLNLEIGQKFTINGVSSTGVTYASSPDRYTIDVAYETNVTGTILESGQAVSNAWVNFMRTDVDCDDYTTSMWYGTKTNANGEFALNLPKDEQAGPDGDDETTADYRLDGYNTEGYWEGYQWVPGKWTPIGYRFQINSEGVLTDTSGTALSEISIAPNVTGKVYKFFKDYDNASDFIESAPAIGDPVQAKQAWLTIWPYDKADANYEIPWEEWDKSIWTETNIETGIFSLMLEPGDYIVTDASMNNFWFNPETVFTIDSNGTLVDEAGDSVENGILVVKPETPNFSGVAYTDSSKTTPLKWGWMMARPDGADDDDWDSYAWINTDQSGYFEMKLADGAWTIEEMGNYNTWTRVNISFSVSGSTVTSSVAGLVSGGQVFVYPPEPNLQGYLENKAGTQVYANAWLTIKPADVTEYEWEDAIWTEYGLQSDGVSYRFKENIRPGDYKVVEVGGYDFFYQTDVRFTVEADGSVTSSSLAVHTLDRDQCQRKI